MVYDTSLLRHEASTGKDGEVWEKIVMYPNEGLGIIGGLKAFGGKVAIRKAIKWFHDQLVTIMDYATGQNSRTDIVAMLDASETLRRYTPEEKAARAKEAANKRRKKSGAMIDHDARIEWLRKDGKSVKEKSKYIRWPESSLNAAFGPSGNPPGRRPNQPKEI